MVRSTYTFRHIVYTLSGSFQKVTGLSRAGLSRGGFLPHSETIYPGILREARCVSYYRLHRLLLLQIHLVQLWGVRPLIGSSVKVNIQFGNSYMSALLLRLVLITSLLRAFFWLRVKSCLKSSNRTYTFSGQEGSTYVMLVIKVHPWKVKTGLKESSKCHSWPLQPLIKPGKRGDKINKLGNESSKTGGVWLEKMNQSVFPVWIFSS